MTRTIAAIDKDITANMRKLRRRHPIKNPMDAGQWQAARDAHPDLDARDHKLYRERGFAQQERDQKAYDAAMKVQRSERTKSRRTVYHRMNVRVDAAFDEFLTKLGCKDGRDAALISHWQDDPAGFRVQVTRLSDAKVLTRFVAVQG